MLLVTAESAGQEAADNAAEAGTVQAGAVEELGVKTEPAALTQDEPEIELQGNTLTYGGLTVELPEGIEARPVDAQDNGNIFCTGHFLSDGNKGRILELRGAQEVYADAVFSEGTVFFSLPPRIRLMYYRAEYGSEQALLCALFDLLPEASGCCMYADQFRKEYVYCLQQDGCLFLFLIQNGDVCLVQELEAEEGCSFDALLKDRAVRWKESGEVVGFWQEPIPLPEPADESYEQVQDKADDGTAPGADAIEKQREESGQQIPQGLLDEIANVMAAGKDPLMLREETGEVGAEKTESAVLDETDGKYAAYLSTTVSGRILTREETLALAGKDMTVRQQVQKASHYNYYITPAEADFDNDGRDDLVVQLSGHYIGGTSGGVDFLFLKGQPDGGYVETNVFGDTLTAFNAISYEGKNYLCQPDFDYGSLIYHGYTVRCFADGKLVEEASLRMVPERYEPRQLSAQAGYENLAARMTEECTAVKERLDAEVTAEGGLMLKGGAEQETGRTPQEYRCDLDNDGQEERYSKGVSYLANYWGKNFLKFTVSTDENENRGLTMLSEEIEGSTDTPMALWAEAYEGKNIVHVLYMTGLDDFRIAGYLVEENGYSQVYEIAADAVYRVEQERQKMIVE